MTLIGHCKTYLIVAFIDVRDELCVEVRHFVGVKPLHVLFYNRPEEGDTDRVSLTTRRDHDRDQLDVRHREDEAAENWRQM